MKDDNEYYTWTKKLIGIRKQNRGLRIGDYRRIESASTMAFMRRTDRVADTAVVVANASDKPVKEVLMVRESKLMDNSPLRDVLGGTTTTISAGVITIEVPARSTMIFVPVVDTTHEFNHYTRVH